MGTSVALLSAELAVEPGGTAVSRMRVRNTGQVVDQISFQPLGSGAAWITVEPATVSLFPGTDETVTVTIAPPRAPDTRPGPTPFGVRAVPQEDPDGAAVAEGVVDVGMFSEFSAELVPTTGRGRRSGRFDLAIDNRGNVPLPVRLSGTDEQQRLAFGFRPASIEALPGSANFTKIKVAPRDTMWRGTPKAHPFQLLIEPGVVPPVGHNGDGHVDVADADAATRDTDDDTPPAGVVVPPASATPAAEPLPPATPTPPSQAVAGTLLQEPILPPWLLKAIAAAAILLIALVVLWKTLLKPTVESAAREIAVEEVAAVEEDVAAVEEEVADANEDVAALEEEVAAGGGGGGSEPGGPGGGAGNDNAITAESASTFFRLAVAAPAGGSDTATRTIEETDTFILTDWVFQNPDGGIGTLTLSVGGDVVHEVGLQNMRDLDFHLVSPLVGTGGSDLTLTLTCEEPELDATECTSAVSFFGYTNGPAEESAE